MIRAFTDLISRVGVMPVPVACVLALALAGTALAGGTHSAHEVPQLMAIVAFYHGVPPTKDVMASFTMEMVPKGVVLQALDVYQVGVNTVCYSQFPKRRADETDEGIEVKPGVQIDRAPLKFEWMAA